MTLALACAVAQSAPAPQFLTQVANPFQSVVHHSGAPATVLRAVNGQQFVHSFAQPSVVRTVAAQPVVHSVAHAVAQPSVVRTVAAQPVVHSVAHAVAQPTTIVRTAVVEEEEVAADASYNFGYSVSDAVSGDSKTRQETRKRSPRANIPSGLGRARRVRMSWSGWES